MKRVLITFSLRRSSYDNVKIVIRQEALVIGRCSRLFTCSPFADSPSPGELRWRASWGSGRRSGAHGKLTKGERSHKRIRYEISDHHKRTKHSRASPDANKQKFLSLFIRKSIRWRRKKIAESASSSARNFRAPSPLSNWTIFLLILFNYRTAKKWNWNVFFFLGDFISSTLAPIKRVREKELINLARGLLSELVQRAFNNSSICAKSSGHSLINCSSGLFGGAVCFRAREQLSGI